MIVIFLNEGVGATLQNHIDYCFVTGFSEEDIHSDNARQIYRWWCNSEIAAGKTPARAAFKPFDHPNCLPGIVLQEIEYDPLRVKDSVVGTDVVRTSGVDTTGQYLDQQRGFERMQSRIDWLIQNKHPYIVKNEKIRWASKDYSHYNNLALPLSQDGTVITHVLHYMDFLKS